MSFIARFTLVSGSLNSTPFTADGEVLVLVSGVVTPTIPYRIPFY